MGKRLCDAHEWEGACEGALEAPDYRFDLARGVLLIRQRYYRGDLDETKSERARRDVPLGHLAADLARIGPGAPGDFVFSVRTCRGVSRSENSIRRYFVTKAAKRLGIYWKGFGWHSFRREAVTAIAAHADPIQAMRLAGHTRMDMTLAYGLEDLTRIDTAIRAFQSEVGVTLTR